MNFTLEISASPALLQVLQSLAATLANPHAEPAASPVPVSTTSDPAVLPVQETERPALTIEQIRAITIEKSRAGSKEAVRQLISAFNISRLTDLPASDFADFHRQLIAL